jgi:hypothetical protein
MAADDKYFEEFKVDDILTFAVKQNLSTGNPVRFDTLDKELLVGILRLLEKYRKHYVYYDDYNEDMDDELKQVLQVPKLSKQEQRNHVFFVLYTCMLFGKGDSKSEGDILAPYITILYKSRILSTIFSALYTVDFKESYYQKCYDQVKFQLERLKIITNTRP